MLRYHFKLSESLIIALEDLKNSLKHSLKCSGKVSTSWSSKLITE